MLSFVIAANLAVAFFNVCGMLTTTAIPRLIDGWSDRRFLLTIIGMDACVWLMVFTVAATQGQSP